MLGLTKHREMIRSKSVFFLRTLFLESHLDGAEVLAILYFEACHVVLYYLLVFYTL